MRQKGFIFISLIVLTTLSGCIVNQNTIKDDFELAINEASISSINRVSNHTTTYFDYYLPITMGRVTSTETSEILKSGQTELLMTLDIVNIVLNNSLARSNDLRTIFKTNVALSSIEGKSMDSVGYDQYYKAQLFNLDQTQYLIVIQTQNVLISAKVDQGLVPNMAYEMLRLARSVVIDRSLIVAAYSNTETFSYQKVNLNMFAQMAPESGTVLDMIEGEETNLLDDDFYNMINDSPTEEEILQD